VKRITPVTPAIVSRGRTGVEQTRNTIMR